MIKRKDLRFPIITYQYWDSLFTSEDTKYSFHEMLDHLSITEENFRDPYFYLDGDQVYLSLKLFIEDCVAEPGTFVILRHMSISNMGMAGVAGLTALTLNDSLNLCMSFYKMFQPAVELSLDSNNDEHVLDIDCIIDFGEYSPLMVELTLGAIKKFADEVSGEPLHANIEFSHAPIWNLDQAQAEQLYSEYFECDVRFNRPKSLMRAKSNILDRPTKNSNLIMHNYSKGVALKEAQRLQDESFAEKVRQTLTAHSVDDIYLSLAELANELELTTRSVCRKLSKENTNFKDIANEVRFEKAKKELKHNGVTVKQLATKLGFSNSESFSRAFKVYTGQTPKQWRLDNTKT